MSFHNSLKERLIQIKSMNHILNLFLMILLRIKKKAIINLETELKK